MHAGGRAGASGLARVVSGCWCCGVAFGRCHRPMSLGRFLERCFANWLLAARDTAGVRLSMRTADMHLCARGAIASGTCGSSSAHEPEGGRWSAERRTSLLSARPVRLHEPAVALRPGEGRFAFRRSTAAIALISREMITGPGPRFAGGIGASLSASSSRPARSGQAGGAPRPPECPVTNRTRRRRIPLHRPNVTGRRPPASRIRNLYIRNLGLSRDEILGLDSTDPRIVTLIQFNQRLQRERSGARRAMNQQELDAAKLEIEKRRLSVDEKRIAIEDARAKREGRFFRANLAIIITALISVGTLAASIWQFSYSREQENLKQQQDSKKNDADVRARLDDQRIRILEYLSAHRDGIFSQDDKVRRQYRTIMLTGLPRDSLPGVFEQLRQSTPGGDKIWIVGTITYEWRSAGHGDCSGRDVGRSDGKEVPSQEKCDAGFEGRIAVCWDGGTFRNGPTKWCTYKSATPETCTGGTARGIIYQCASRSPPRATLNDHIG